MLGVIGNGLIAVVNCTDCTRKKMISKISFILTGLAISRIFLVWLLISEAYIKIFSPNLLSSISFIELISYLWIIISQLSFWFATILCIFYFVKIVNFSHYIFLWLKRRINTIFFLLIGCLLVSWLFTFPVAVKIIRDNKIQYINTSWQIYTKKSELIFHYAFTNVGIFLFFLIIVSLLSFLLLILSLWRHTRHMQLNATGNKDPTTTAHIRAIKAVISFLALFVAYCLAFLIATSSYFMPETELAVIWGEMIALLYPSSHSFILILGNSKLKQASVRMLCKVKAMLMGRNC
ncbi:Taste receptor type 2 member 114 [Lemmus lemmus]